MSPQTGSELLAPSSGQAHAIHKLPVLVLMVHSRCNCRCVMCDIWKTTEMRELRSSDLQPHLESIRNLGVEWVVFSGGEPLMNPGLFDLAPALHDMGIRLALLTTGLLLERYAELVALHLDEVIVSLDGPEDVHDQIRRVPSAFRLLADGVALVKTIRPDLPIRARTTVQKANFRHLQQTVSTARTLGLDSISFLAADVSSQAFNRDLIWPAERQSEIALTSPEIDALEGEMAELIRNYTIEIASGFVVEAPAKLRRIVRHFRAQIGEVVSNAPACNAPWVSAVVEADGAVRPCFFHPAIGSIADSSLDSVLNSPRALAFREQLDIDTNPTCRRCVCSLNYAVKETN